MKWIIIGGTFQPAFVWEFDPIALIQAIVATKNVMFSFSMVGPWFCCCIEGSNGVDGWKECQ